MAHIYTFPIISGRFYCTDKIIQEEPKRHAGNHISFFCRKYSYYFVDKIAAICEQRMIPAVPNGTRGIKSD